MKNSLVKLIRWATRRFWTYEIGVTEGVARLRKLNMAEEACEMEFDLEPGLKERMAHHFAAMLADAPNYAECRFDLVKHARDGAEWITVTVKKDSGKTPHQLRLEAEEELAKARNEIVELKLALCRSEARRQKLLGSI